jgi:hypothetical protein
MSSENQSHAHASPTVKTRGGAKGCLATQALPDTEASAGTTRTTTTVLAQVSLPEVGNNQQAASDVSARASKWIGFCRAHKHEVQECERQARIEWGSQGRTFPAVLPPSSPLMMDVAYATGTEDQPRDPELVAMMWQEIGLHRVLAEKCGFNPNDAVGEAFCDQTPIEERIQRLEDLIIAKAPDGDDEVAVAA